MKNINNLINEYKQGNKEVFDNIFIQEERQIKDIIKTFHHMEYEDLYQVACIGLLKAINSYDTSKNIKFNSYMYNVVKNEILMTLRNNNTMKNSNMEEVSTEAQTTDDLTVMDTLKSDVNIEDEYLVKEEYRELYKLLNSLNIEMVDDIECPQGFTDGIVVYYPNGEALQIFVEDNKIVVLDEYINVWLEGTDVFGIAGVIIDYSFEKIDKINNSNDYISF